ncbi:MAG: MmcQ/YjbR family DNA-binding protein [Beijerinckiaceae bacterium]|nr:MmcQ/YjbR family DNA-binding protein [Beijerinckiaceae bacterium]
MTRAEFNAFCGALPATTHVVQWRGSDVWKVGGKVFAICGWSVSDDNPGITFKTSDMGYEALRDAPGFRPAPYLASRGMKWIQRCGPTTADEVSSHILASHAIVAAGLPKRTRTALGLDQGVRPTAGRK